MFSHDTKLYKKQEEILKSIELNNIEQFKDIFSDNDFDITFQKNTLVKKIALYNRVNFFLYVFFSHRTSEIDYTVEHNYCLRYFSENGNLEAVNLLLTLPNVDASDFRNLAIRNSFQNNHFEIVDILWEIETVKNTLAEYDDELFQHLTHKKMIHNVKNF